MKTSKTVGLVAVISSPIIITFGLRIYSLFSAYSHMNPLEDSVGKQNISIATVDIYSHNSYLGRGSYLAGRRIIATNNHVLGDYCRSLPEQSCNRQKIVLSQLIHKNLKIPTKIQASTCVDWLDLCLFKIEEHSLFTERDEHNSLSLEARPINQSLMIVNNPMPDDKMGLQMIRGQLLFQSESLGIASVYSKKGMSGSPLLSEDEKFKGIATRNMDDLPVFFTVIDHFFSKFSRPSYKAVTIFIPSLLILKLIPCLDEEADRCKAIQTDIFASLLSDYRDAIESGNLSMRVQLGLKNDSKIRIALRCKAETEQERLEIAPQCSIAKEF